MATEETDHENGENTGDHTEHETTKRPRRRFPGESPDTAPTAQVEAGRESTDMRYNVITIQRHFR